MESGYPFLYGGCQTDMISEKQELRQLIKKASEGSAEALSILCEKYKPLLEAEVRRHTDPQMSDQDVTDLKQEALIYFYQAVCNYDYSEENVEFGLYAKICIGNALVSFLRHYNRQKDCKVISIEDVSGTVADDGVYDPVQILIEEENLRKLKRDIEENLSPYESRVWWLYVSGMSAADIARKLDSQSVRSVNNAIYRIRKKLRQVLENK